MKLDAGEIVQRYEVAKTDRAPFESDWREAAAFVMPRSSNAWQSDPLSPPSGRTPSRRRVFDTTAGRALMKFVAIMNHMCTPMTMKWHRLRASNRELMRIRAVSLYYEQLTDVLFDERYQPSAAFTVAQDEVYTSLGLYGTGPKYIGQRRLWGGNQSPGAFYKSCPLRDIFLLNSEEGKVDTAFRRLPLTARQMRQKFTDDELPKEVRDALAVVTQSDTRRFEVVHLVAPRDDYEQGAWDVRRFPYIGCYVFPQTKSFIGDPLQGGYRTMPYITPRTQSEPDVPYGYSPTQVAMASIGGVNAMRKTHIRQGQKAADPPMLGRDDGVLNSSIDQTPGAYNPGGVNAQGNLLVRAMETGNFNVAEKLIAEEQDAIKDPFFVNLFQILIENPQMSATEVVERSAEKAIIAAPAMGKEQTEDLGPTIERELDILAQIPGKLPEMPPELIEAQGEYTTLYTSPMARAMQAEEATGFMRLSDAASNWSKATGDTRPLRRLNFDTAIPDIAEILSVPAKWLHSDEELQASDQQAAQQQQQQTAIEAAPAISGMMKAQAANQNRRAA